MIVIGAGMAGLLAAGMLRGDCEEVWEAQPEIPNNHSAVLRFRSSVVGDSLNIRFKEVQAVKAVHPWRNPIADAMAYSIKTNGVATMRSIITADSAPKTRYIAPPDLIQRMVERVTCPIELEMPVNRADFEVLRRQGTPVISTIPMPTLMAILDWPGRKTQFLHIEGANYGCKLAGVSAYCSLYIPDPNYPFSRISVTGDELVVECYGKGCKDHDPSSLCLEATELLGLRRGSVASGGEPWSRRQKYAKILPIEDSLRREFMMWASQEWGVYSLGRFATWRPGLLLDDLVNDVRVIQKLASEKGASYQHKLKGE